MVAQEAVVMCISTLNYVPRVDFEWKDYANYPELSMASTFPSNPELSHRATSETVSKKSWFHERLMERETSGKKKFRLGPRSRDTMDMNIEIRRQIINR